VFFEDIQDYKLIQKHTRTPSHAEISEFKELTKKDALQSLQKELNKLILTAPADQTEVREATYSLKIKLYFLKLIFFFVEHTG
jgi:hypothetical protein